MQQLPENSVYMGHSGGSGDALDGMVVNAIQGGNSPIHVVALGSPERKEDFIKVGKEVGVKSVVKISNPNDPIVALGDSNHALKYGEHLIHSLSDYYFTNDPLLPASAKVIPPMLGFSLGIRGGIGAIGSIGASAINIIIDDFKNHHSYESYVENPLFIPTLEKLLDQKNKRYGVK